MPISLVEAKRFVATHHRHNMPPVGWKFGVGLHDDDGQLVGVAVASRPVARRLDDGLTLEVTRTCTNGHRNANSMLYGAICRAAKALGYAKVITYTLAEEPGTSLHAAGFMLDAELESRGSWNVPSRPRYEHDLFGNERIPPGPKNRWVRHLKPTGDDRAGVAP